MILMRACLSRCILTIERYPELHHFTDDPARLLSTSCGPSSTAPPIVLELGIALLTGSIAPHAARHPPRRYSAPDCQYHPRLFRCFYRACHSGIANMYQGTRAILL